MGGFVGFSVGGHGGGVGSHVGVGGSVGVGSHAVGVFEAGAAAIIVLPLNMANDTTNIAKIAIFIMNPMLISFTDHFQTKRKLTVSQSLSTDLFYSNKFSKSWTGDLRNII